ncbi:MAG: DUF1559 domain-containing protein, partial [Pirellulales bacterium]|nr:DUF1559 domain-containing protein [Pirellulales bacterium]
MQFTLKTLLLLFVVVASALGTLGPWGLVVVAYLGVMIVSYRIARARKAPKAVTLCVSMAVILLCVLGSMPFWTVARCTPPYRHSMWRLRNIALALHNYHNEYGSFPPAYVADENGKPMHSWRVLLLERMGRPDLQDEYRFDEPWDSPHNNKLAAECVPYGFHSWTSPEGMTGFVAVTGPGTAWSGTRGTRLDEITDGPERTLLLVQIDGSTIPWNAPIDLTLDEILAGDTSHGVPVAGDFSSTGGPAGNVLTADGTVHYMAQPSARTIRDLATLAGGERAELIDLDTPIRLVPTPPEEMPAWQRAVGLLVLAVSFILLVSRPLPPRFLAADRSSDQPEKTEKVAP